MHDLSRILRILHASVEQLVARVTVPRTLYCWKCTFKWLHISRIKLFRHAVGIGRRFAFCSERVTALVRRSSEMTAEVRIGPAIIVRLCS